MPKYTHIAVTQANRHLINANIKLVDENKDLKARISKALELIQDIEEKFSNQEFASIDKKLVDIDYVKTIEKTLQGKASEYF